MLFPNKPLCCSKVLFNRKNHPFLFTFLSFLLALLVLFVSCLNEYYPEKYYHENSFMDSNTFTVGKTHYGKANQDLSMADFEDNLDDDKNALTSLPISEAITSIQTSVFFAPEDSHSAFGVLLISDHFNLKDFGFFSGPSFVDLASQNAVIINHPEQSSAPLQSYALKKGFSIVGTYERTDDQEIIGFSYSFNMPVLVTSVQNKNLLDGASYERNYFSVHLQKQITEKELNMLSNITGYNSSFVIPTFDYLIHPLLFYIPLMNLLQPTENIAEMIAIMIDIAVIFGFLLADFLQEKKEQDYYRSLVLLGTPSKALLFEKIFSKSLFILTGTAFSLLAFFLIGKVYSVFSGFFFFVNGWSVFLIFLSPLVLIASEAIMETYLVRKIRV
jgi:hypothetical protein